MPRFQPKKRCTLRHNLDAERLFDRGRVLLFRPLKLKGKPKSRSTVRKNGNSDHRQQDSMSINGEATPSSKFEQRHTYVRLLGKGGQGLIHLWRRNLDQTLVAVKTISSKTSSQMELLRCLKEASDNIPVLQLYEEHVQGEKLEMSVEYCSGGDLLMFQWRLMKLQTPCPESFLWHVYSQMCKALAFLHDGYGRRCCAGKWRPILHRDIKNENVFLQYAGEDQYPLCKLADFDHSRFEDESSLDDFVGTAVWNSPEHWADVHRPLATKGGDVWGLGSVIHTLATGFIPGENNEWNQDAGDLEHDQTRKRTVYRLDDPAWGYSQRLQERLCQALKKDAALRLTALQLVENLVPEIELYGLDEPDKAVLEYIHKANSDQNYHGTLFVWDEEIKWNSGFRDYCREDDEQYVQAGHAIPERMPQEAED